MGVAFTAHGKINCLFMTNGYIIISFPSRLTYVGKKKCIPCVSY